MAHFAELDNNNIVKRVIVVANEELLDNEVESEAKGIVFCQSLLGGTWVQTSYNNNIRKQYAGIGFTYDAVNDVFVAPQPYPSWSLDNNFDWQPPTPRPEGIGWYWDEDNLSWTELN
jgi:hypothetical protein